jgi:serine/threonine-protein kinase
MQEGAVTGQLEHPGIVPIYGMGVDSEGRPYYAMRFIAGRSLAEAIRDFHEAERGTRVAGERELALRGLLRRFIDVSNAVAFAHDRGWLHRDIKPSNVMLGDYGETVIVDWGLARQLRAGGEQREAERTDQEQQPAADPALATLPAPENVQTRAGQIIGTPGYMSPEQAAGHTSELTRTSDVYSLGATLFTILTGKPPLQGESLEVLRKTIAGEFLRPRQVKVSVPVGLEAVAIKAMALQPEARYPTAQALARDVEQWLADEPVSACREPWRVRLWRWMRRHRVLVSALAALLVTALVALILGLWLVNEEKRNTAEALRQTQKAEQTASEQQHLALETLNGVLNEINNKAHGFPGALDLHRGVLDAVREKLEKLPRSAQFAQAIDHEYMKIHLALGDLSLTVQAGGLTKAKEEYQKAHALAQQMADDPPDRMMAQSDLALTLSRLGDIHERVADTKAALDAYQRAADIHELLSREYPRRGIHQFNLAMELGKIAGAQMQLGESDLALASAQRKYEISRSRYEADRANPSTRRHLALALALLGDMQLSRGDNKAARDHFQESNDLFKALAGANKERDADYAGSLERVGYVLEKKGEDMLALQAFKEYCDINRRMAVADPNNASKQRSLAVSLMNQGEVQFTLQDSTGGLASFTEAHAICKRLAEPDSKDAGPQRDLAVSLEKLGDAQVLLGNPKAAQGPYRESLAICERLASNPRNAGAQHDLGIALGKLGEAQLRAGEIKAATESHQRAVDVLKRQDNPRQQNALFKKRMALLLYNSACCYARSMPQADSAQRKNELARRAVELLGEALDRGFNDAATFETDTDLDSLRQREDFRKLLARVKAGKK